MESRPARRPGEPGEIDGGPASDPYAQVAFLKQELQGKYSNVLHQLQGTNDTNQAAGIWTRNYEAPKIDNTAQRLRGGAGVGHLDAQGNFVPGVPGLTVNSPQQAADRGGNPGGTGPAPGGADTAPGGAGPGPSVPAPPPTPPTAFDAVMAAYAQPQQQQQAPQASAGAATPPVLGTNAGAIAASSPLLQQLIAQKRMEMGFAPIAM